MEDLKDIIKDYMNSWKECTVCKDMCKPDVITNYPEYSVCDDCVEHEVMGHWIS
jgi:hypothetical protein